MPPQVGLAAKLLRDTGEAAVRRRTTELHGKGSTLLQAAHAKGTEAIASVAAGVSSFTGKEEYAFGDLTRAAVARIKAHFSKPAGSEAQPRQRVAAGVRLSDGAPSDEGAQGVELQARVLG